MSLYVLDALLWIVGIRGHIPHSDGFPAGRGESSLGGNVRRLLRVLAAAVVTAVFLSLVLWAAVWLAIKLL